MSIAFKSAEYFELMEALLRGEKPTTDDLVKALKEDGVSDVIIDYLTDLHTRKVEGKRAKQTMASRSQNISKFIFLFQEVNERARRNGKILGYPEMVSQVAKKAGCSERTVKRYLPKGKPIE